MQRARACEFLTLVFVVGALLCCVNANPIPEGAEAKVNEAMETLNDSMDKAAAEVGDAVDDASDGKNTTAHNVTKNTTALNVSKDATAQHVSVGQEKASDEESEPENVAIDSPAMSEGAGSVSVDLSPIESEKPLEAPEPVAAALGDAADDMNDNMEAAAEKTDDATGHGNTMVVQPLLVAIMLGATACLRAF